MRATTEFRAPRAIIAVVSYGDHNADPEVKAAFEDEGVQYTYDLNADEVFVRYTLDTSYEPKTRLLAETPEEESRS